MQKRTQAVLALMVMPVVVVVCYAIVIGACLVFGLGAVSRFAQHMLSGSSAAVSDAASVVALNRFVILPVLLTAAALLTARWSVAGVGFITTALIAGIVAGYPSGIAALIASIVYFGWMHVVRFGGIRVIGRPAT